MATNKIMLPELTQTESAQRLRLLIFAGLNVLKNNWQAITLLLLVFVSYLSLRPPGVHEHSVFVGVDKLKHLIAYACLVVPLFIAKPRNWQCYVFGILVFSGLIELLQPYFERTTDIADLIANGAGLVMGCGIAHMFILSMPNRP